MLQRFWKLGQNAITTFPCFGVGKENKRRKNSKKQWQWQRASAVLPTLSLTCLQPRALPQPLSPPGQTLATPALTAVQLEDAAGGREKTLSWAATSADEKRSVPCDFWGKLQHPDQLPKALPQDVIATFSLTVA